MKLKVKCQKAQGRKVKGSTSDLRAFLLLTLGLSTFRPLTFPVAVDRMFKAATLFQPTKSPWHNWIARRPPKPKVTGSSPVGDG